MSTEDPYKHNDSPEDPDESSAEQSANVEPQPQAAQSMPAANTRRQIHCPSCGTNLAGVPIGGDCPGCGTVVALNQGFSSNGASSGKATAALVLGICSIVGCFFYGLPGLICGILAIVFAGQVRREVTAGELNPSVLPSANAGRVCGIIGLSLGAIWVLVFIAYMIFIIAFMVPQAVQQTSPSQPTPSPQVQPNP